MCFAADFRYFDHLEKYSNKDRLLDELMLLKILFASDFDACHLTFPFVACATLGRLKFNLILFFRMFQ